MIGTTTWGWPATAAILLSLALAGPAAGEAAGASGAAYVPQAERLCRPPAPGAAQRALDDAIARVERYDPSDPRLVWALTEVAGLLLEFGRPGDAEGHLAQALRIVAAAHTKDEKAAAIILGNLAMAQHRQGRLDEAFETAGRARQLAEKAYGTSHPAVARILRTHARIHDQRGEFADAEAAERRGLAIHEQAYGPAHVAVADSLDGLAYALLKRKRYAEGETHAQRALAIFERECGPDHQLVHLTRQRVLRLHDLAEWQARLRPLWLLAGIPVLALVWLGLRFTRSRAARRARPGGPPASA